MDDTNKTIIEGTQESIKIMENIVCRKIKRKEKINGKRKLRIKKSEDQSIDTQKKEGKTAQEIK